MNDCFIEQRLVNNMKFFLALPPVLCIALATMFLHTAHAVPLPALEQSVSGRIQSFNDLPPGSAAAIAKAMLKGLPQEYQLQEISKGFSMSNPSHSMVIAFTPDGLQVKSAGKTWGMALSGIGSPGLIKPVQQATLINDDGRMLYARGDISEWYVNSPWGVEQGFTIQTAPEGKNRNSLVVELSLSGDLQPVLHGNTMVLADAEGRHIVRYTGLQVFDADSKVLPTHLHLTGSTLRIHIDDTHANYPVTIDPWIQLAKLTAGDGAAGDSLGYSVAISGDTIVVGAYNDDDNGTNSGSAYVFVKPGSGWADMTQTAKLTTGDGAADDAFGISVAISGETIVVGAYYDDDNGTDSGSAYVFAKPGSGWADMTQTAKLTAGDGAAGDAFGISVAISGDMIVVGSYLDDDNGTDSGSAYVFVKPGSGWADMTQTAKLTAGDGAASDSFAWSVAISGDTIAVGSYLDDDNGGNSGSAYVFAKPGSGWADMTQTAKLTAGDGAESDLFGISVAISGDTIVVGACNDDDNGFNSGSAYVFVKPGSGWADMTQTVKLIAGDGAAVDRFGWSVAISGDTIVVGAYLDDDIVANSGSAYGFVKPESGWADMTQTTKLTAGDWAVNDMFGYAVAISSDTIVVGSYNDDDNGTDSGSVYLFSINEFTVTYNGNTNTGGSVPIDDNIYNITDTVTVLANTGSLVKAGSTFVGWNTAANGKGTPYNDGDTFAMGSSNVTLYAQWSAHDSRFQWWTFWHVIMKAAQDRSRQQ